MRKILATLITAGAITMGVSALSSAPAGASTGNGMPTTWTPTAERVTVSLIEAQSEFAGYDAQCVLGEIQDEFSSPRNFARHASRGADDYRITRIAIGVVMECGDEDSITSY